jgi:hypothetical protein
VDGERDFVKAPGVGVVVSDGEIGSGWIAVDLAAYKALAPGRVDFAQADCRREAGPARIGSEEPITDAGEKALIKARLLAWAERLRSAEPRPASLPAPRSVPAPDIVTLDRRSIRLRKAAPAPLPLRPPLAARAQRRALSAPPAARAQRPAPVAPPQAPPPPLEPTEILPPLPSKKRPFSSRRARVFLLAMAAAYFVTGLVHSLARWKPGRVIVIPATADSRSVIT